MNPKPIILVGLLAGFGVLGALGWSGSQAGESREVPPPSSEVAAGEPSGSAVAASAERGSGATLLVDVRTLDEFRGGHVAGAINIPLHELSRRLAELGDRQRPIAVYCRSGSRSGVARSLLVRQGFTRVVNAGSLSAARRRYGR